ncbi:MAG: Tetratricopeptide 2 repeat protein [Myxococcales bacterium]|nr:Tetratricopeptide 2 repeat protein [Myxococcales bacterium]
MSPAVPSPHPARTDLAPVPGGRHTRFVRWSWILVISLGAGAAHAKPAPPPPPPAPVTDGDFWRDVIEPHADEVARIVTATRNGIRIADEALQTDAEWAVDQRMRYFEDAYGMLRYARKLSPENIEVLALLGRSADELGKTRQAIEALEASIAITGPDKAKPEVVGRLGAIYLRLGDRNAAIRWLRTAQGPLNGETAQPLVHLANALAARGEITAAVDTLINAMPAQNTSYYSQELTLAAFTLAVILDRDEQRSAAFEVLDRMKATLQTSFGPQVQNVLATLRYAPAEDQHYYQGLLYEVMDQYVEARAAFALYAASGDPPWKGRALDHVRAIDAQRRATPATPVASKKPPTVIRRKVYRP